MICPVGTLQREVLRASAIRDIDYTAAVEVYLECTLVEGQCHMVPFLLFSRRCRTILALFSAGGDPRCISPAGSCTVEIDGSNVLALYILEVDDIIAINGFLVTTAEEVKLERESFGEVVLRILQQTI